MQGMTEKLQSAAKKVARASLAALVVSGALLATAAPALADDATAPDAPAQPTVTTAAGFVSVSFSPPADGGSAISRLLGRVRLERRRPVGHQHRHRHRPSRSARSTTGNTYTCTVVATNDMGDSAPSVASDPIVVVAAAPDQPAQPVATADEHLDLARARRAQRQRQPDHELRRDVHVERRRRDRNGDQRQPADRRQRPLARQHVQLHRDRDERDRHVDRVAEHRRHADRPDRPRRARPADRGPRTTDRSRCRSRRRPTAAARSRPTSSTARRATAAPRAIASDVASPITVSGLDNGNTYTCTSPRRTASATAPRPTLPSRRSRACRPSSAAHSVTPANNSAYVTYGDSAYDANDPITSYTATCMSSDGGDPGTATGETVPVLVTGLTNGATYTCTLGRDQLPRHRTGVGRVRPVLARADSRHARRADAHARRPEPERRVRPHRATRATRSLRTTSSATPPTAARPARRPTSPRRSSSRASTTATRTPAWCGPRTRPAPACGRRRRPRSSSAPTHPTHRRSSTSPAAATR